MNKQGLLYTRIILSILLLLLISACQLKQSEPDPFFTEWKERAANAEPRIPEKEESDLDDLLGVKPYGEKDQAEAEKKPTLEEYMSDITATLPSQPITVRFVKEDVANVLRALGRMANQNIIINPSVEGTVNAHIEETPWNQVLMGIVNSYGLILSREGKLLRVMTLEDLEKQVKRKALQLEQEQVAPLVTRTKNIEFANPEQLIDSVKPLLTLDKEGKPRGSATVDVHSRSLVIRETEENMAKVIQLIESLDRPTPQILIGAHIVEATRDTAREMGIQWGGFIDANDKPTRFITPGGIGGGVDSATGRMTYEAGVLGTSRTGIGGRGFAVDLPANAIVGIPPASLGLLSYSGAGILEIQLSALQKAGKINILSSPSIATLDNNQAIIESGKDVPFQTFEDGTFKVIYKEATLKLTVTPHVISDKMIKLNIEAKNDEVDFTNTVNGNPLIKKKLAQTQLIVENGATVVIAGLAKEKHENSDAGVPGAKDIPLFGWLFKKDSKSANFEELLIFITPKILSKGDRLEETGKVSKLYQ